MNTYQALQRASDGRWDFTCNGHPAGYCRPYREWWLKDGELRTDMLISPQSIEDYKSTEHKHHGDGHATAEEAAACYREYLLDHKLQLMRKDSGSQRKCKVCGKWTNFWAQCDSKIWHLCEEHNNREEVAKLLYISADTVIWSSW